MRRFQRCPTGTRSKWSDVNCGRETDSPVRPSGSVEVARRARPIHNGDQTVVNPLTEPAGAGRLVEALCRDVPVQATPFHPPAPTLGGKSHSVLEERAPYALLAILREHEDILDVEGRPGKERGVRMQEYQVPDGVPIENRQPGLEARSLAPPVLAKARSGIGVGRGKPFELRESCNQIEERVCVRGLGSPDLQGHAGSPRSLDRSSGCGPDTTSRSSRSVTSAMNPSDTSSTSTISVLRMRAT